MPKTADKTKLYPKTIREGDQGNIAYLLSKGANIDSVDEHGKTALWWAAFNGKLELVSFLIANGANPNLPDQQEKTPLDIASELALGGYREPGEDNVHGQIVEKLKPITDNPYQKEISGITEQMARLGLYATRVSTQSDGASHRHADKAQQAEQPKDETCTLL